MADKQTDGIGIIYGETILGEQTVEESNLRSKVYACVATAKRSENSSLGSMTIDEATDSIMEAVKAQLSQLLIKERLANKSVEAVKYLIDVWDEVMPSWRDKPNHVERKFIEAENQLGEKS